MSVIDPVKLVITNWPQGQTELITVSNNQENEALGTREVEFGGELYIEREDFMIEPPKKYFRLFPGKEVRLMNAYFVTCTGYEADEQGNVTTVYATYDPATKSGSGFDARKVKGTIHWVNAASAVDITVRLYENLVEESKGVYNEDGTINLNPNSVTVMEHAKAEHCVGSAKPYDRFQFLRNGFFCVDFKDTTPDSLVFNRIVSLKSSFVIK
jgi:glutaminyl-tRNA synthetase